MTGAATRISLLRHGQVHNPLDLYYGRLPRFGLSANGRAEARRAASLLSTQAVTALYCSPLLRARQTAAELGFVLTGIPRHLSQRLIEARTPFDGQTRLELEARHWDLYTDAPVPFEQPADLVQRVQRFLADARRRHPEQHVVGVTHGDLIAFTFLWARGAPLAPAQKRHLQAWGMSDDYPAHASIITLTFANQAPDEPPAVAYFNPHRPAKE